MLQPKAEPIRLLLVDDHEVVRIGLRTLFQRAKHIQVVGEADSAAGAVEQAAQLRPNVVLLDLRLPDGTGVEACREIRAASPETKVLFLTSFSDEEAVFSSTFAGASGYLLKEIGGDNLIRAVETVARGQSILDPGMSGAILTRMRSLSGPGGKESDPTLSPQQKRVLILITKGKTNKEIAHSLDLSVKTVTNYVRLIFQKLHVTRRSQAAAYFARQIPD